jgi:hypothetical protein
LSLYAGAARERMIELQATDIVDAPTRTTKPHFQVSPRTAQGLPTQGIALTLIAPRVGAAIGTGGAESGGSGGSLGGFQVTIYRCVPILGTWAEMAPFTAMAHYGEQYVLGDIPGGWGIYLQITGISEPGRLLVGIAEMD